MPKRVIQYSLLVSCPGDIQEEVRSVEECVNRFNTLFSDALGIEIITKHWRKNSYAQSGGKPQSLLNKQFVNDCDAAVAILWTRFGTPTDEYGSGTEEEVEIMLASGKQVFMYFSDAPIPPSQLNSNEYKRVLAFREKYKDRGIYFSYSSSDEFKTLFFAHLSQHFLSEKRMAEIKEERHSVLKLVGIDAHHNIDDLVHIVDFVPNVRMQKEQYFDTLSVLFHEVSGINLEKRNERPQNSISFGLSLEKPVEINDKEREIIQSVAKTLGIEIDNGFFNLGNLSQSTIPSGIWGGGTLTGTKQEKAKYQKIREIIETVSLFLDWIPIEKAFSGKKCILLALQNCGTAIDEDVEIALRIPHECLITLSEFPEFSNDEKGYLLNDCNMKEMFGIGSTSEYSDYSVSIINRQAFPQFHSSSNALPGYTPEYDDDYTNELRDIFCYDVYKDGNCYIVKLKFEYIKHNTIVAFPTVIFIQEAFSSIDYTITSKNIPDVVRGSLNVE